MAFQQRLRTKYPGTFVIEKKYLTDFVSEKMFLDNKKKPSLALL